ncbi:MAG: FGGY-family carbohydrate kinase, partial [Actinomycetota bacterium]|nr:FGGY-family carbohydrate kinase [Actinomycetota bacterium]
LLFLPHLTGERAPRWDADARGVLFGLTLRHRREHLVRAVLEGVAFQLRAVLETLGDLGVEPHQVRATGGFTRSPLWLQLTADVFGRGLSVPRAGKATLLGAALLGMVALGLVESLDEAAAAVPVDEVYRPDPQAAGAYGALFALFEDLHARLEGSFTQLAQLTGRARAGSRPRS